MPENRENASITKKRRISIPVNMWKLVRIAVARSARAVRVILVPTDTSSDRGGLHGTVHAVGSILREETIPAGNTFCDAMRGAPPPGCPRGWRERRNQYALTPLDQARAAYDAALQRLELR